MASFQQQVPTGGASFGRLDDAAKRHRSALQQFKTDSPGVSGPSRSASCLSLAFAALAGPLVAPYDPVIGELDSRHLGPLSYSDATGFHLLGTDHSGRDLLSRILFGARNSVWVMIVALTSGMANGIPIALCRRLVSRRVGRICYSHRRHLDGAAFSS